MIDRETLRTRREKLRLTQEELAQLVGVRGETICRYESGVTIPAPTQIALDKVLSDREHE